MEHGQTYTIRNADLRGEPIIEGEAVLLKRLRVEPDSSVERWLVRFISDDAAVERLVNPGDLVPKAPGAATSQSGRVDSGYDWASVWVAPYLGGSRGGVVLTAEAADGKAQLRLSATEAQALAELLLARNVPVASDDGHPDPDTAHGSPTSGPVQDPH